MRSGADLSKMRCRKDDAGEKRQMDDGQKEATCPDDANNR